MTGEAFQLEFRSAFICLNGVRLPRVGIGGEGLSALVEHSELPGIEREMLSLEQGMFDNTN